MYLRHDYIYEKIAVIGLSALLAACASGEYTTDVKTESHREEYSVAAVEQPVISEYGVADGISEQNVEQNVVKMTPDSEKKVVKMSPQAKPAVSITPPSAKQVAMNPRYGFTIQVVAVGRKVKWTNSHLNYLKMANLFGKTTNW